MKKKIKYILVFILIFTFCAQSTINAQILPDEKLETTSITIDINDIDLNKKTVMADGAVLTPITKEEYVKYLAKGKGISYEEAYRMETALNNAKSATGTIRYLEYEKIYSHQDNSNLKARVVAELKIWYDTSLYKQIEDVAYVFSELPEGSTTAYEWRQLAVICTPNPNSNNHEFPATSVRLGARGYFMATLSVGMGIEAFNTSISVGGNVYLRTDDMDNMDHIYSLY